MICFFKTDVDFQGLLKSILVKYLLLVIFQSTNTLFSAPGTTSSISPKGRGEIKEASLVIAASLDCLKVVMVGIT